MAISLVLRLIRVQGEMGCSVEVIVLLFFLYLYMQLLLKVKNNSATQVSPL